MMRRIFSTEGSPPALGFSLWREALNDRFVPADFTALGSGSFAGSIDAATVGSVAFTLTAMDAMRSEVSEAAMRRLKGDVLVATVVLDGRNARQAGGREAVLGPGDFAVYDGSSSVFVSDDRTRTLSIEVPRKRFEDALGPTRLYATLAVDGALAGASLATGFLRQLLDVEDRLDEAARARMAAIGQDLLIAAVAERLAREVPASIYADVVVQRAKAHVEAWRGDPRLDPAEVARASGVSLRRLQELFGERGLGIADLIWDRRLAAAAAMLADPVSLDRSIGGIAFACGFSNQAHFSTRFRARFGLAPRDFRAQALGDATSPSADRRTGRIPRTPPC